MSLIDEFMEPCFFMVKDRQPDPEGGWLPGGWREGATIDCAITRDTSLEARQMESQGTKNVYTITTKKGQTLDFHDVIKRKKDQKIFRVTSDGGEKETPNSSTLDISQVTAEEWDIV